MVKVIKELTLNNHESTQHREGKWSHHMWSSTANILKIFLWVLSSLNYVAPSHPVKKDKITNNPTAYIWGILFDIKKDGRHISAYSLCTNLKPNVLTLMWPSCSFDIIQSQGRGGRVSCWSWCQIPIFSLQKPIKSKLESKQKWTLENAQAW